MGYVASERPDALHRMSVKVLRNPISLPIQGIAVACGLWLMRRLSTNRDDDRASASVSAGSVIVRGSTSSTSAGRPSRQPPDHELTLDVILTI
jgi:hypothetical protein